MVVILVTLFATFRVGLDRGFDHTIGIEAWGRVLFGVGAAISDLVYGVKGYVVDRVVETLLQTGGLTGDNGILTALGYPFPANLQNAAVIDGAIQSAIHFPHVTTDVRGAGGDDLGYVDFVKIAFCLFGPRLISLYLTYFVLLIVPIVVFVVAFRKHAACLSCLATVVIAHLLVFSSALLDVGPNTLGSPIDPRFLSLLVVVPGLHFALAMLFRMPPTPRNVALGVVQAAMIVLACWIRFSAIWAPLGLIVLAAVLFLRVRSPRPLWGLGILALLWAAHALYVGQTLSPVYANDGEPTRHVVWHSIFYSLQFNPAWANTYAPRYDNATGDELSLVVTRKYLERHPPVDPASAYDPVTHSVKWSTIEASVRGEFFEILAENPRYVIATFVKYKPLYIAGELRFLSASLLPASPGRLMFVLALGAAVAASLAFSRADRRAFGATAILLVGAFVVSLLPNILTVPTRTVLADQFLMLLAAAIAGGITAAVYMLAAVPALLRRIRLVHIRAAAR